MEEKDIIKETISKLLEKINISGNVLVGSFENDIIANIQTGEAGFLIGQAGKNLEAFQYITRALVNKKNGQPIQFIIDVNDYRKDKIESLRGLAKDIAKQTLAEKVSITLRPMPAFERRIIHLALFNNPNIKTESIGDGAERRIVVKPIE
ncbi:MAG: hypothetical protein COU84_02100 [Candidatus Portnoybacteria bacterium CG10_big_fil_rev_8_21_14_0_10_43_39]|uniref:R3H domain-containing protein n=2 Tax=Candidatus Portnoyibacteriota TaxID=1817913 RepID=A0A2M7YLE9_9BACT|nr:MAG: hypothetical protein CO160_01990 [Candidatus Portnoybacteria bacterium CG_4_9_14_3_um_filter_43_11]PJE59157.1 MAG: hypothetical protein COU84_02100 [Candidatus Portnoybacteria bacterium CG10_big_fil_rev_8_21_14_0_10_43_39]